MWSYAGALQSERCFTWSVRTISVGQGEHHHQHQHWHQHHCEHPICHQSIFMSTDIFVARNEQFCYCSYDLCNGGSLAGGDSIRWCDMVAFLSCYDWTVCRLSLNMMVCNGDLISWYDLTVCRLSINWASTNRPSTAWTQPCVWLTTTRNQP